MQRLPKHITLKHLNAFVAVAQEGSFTMAGQRMHQTQSSMTSLVRQLEEALGCVLFARTSRRVQLTHVGREFLPRVLHMLKDFESAVSDVIRYGTLERGQVTVAAAPSAITELLAPAVLAFSDQYPGVRVCLRDENSRQIQHLVSRQEADFGLTGRWMEANANDLVFDPCIEDQFGVLYPLKAPWPAYFHNRAHWSMLSDHKQIGLVGDTGILSMLRGRMDLPSDITAPFYEASSTTSQAALVKSGMGLAVLPALAAARVQGDGLAFQLLQRPVIRRTLCLITHAHQELSPMAQELMRIVRQHLRRAALPHGCRLAR